MFFLRRRGVKISLRPYIVLVLCFIQTSFLFIFSPLSPAGTEVPHIVRVGAYENPPKIYTDIDNTVVGIFPDILNHIAEKEGWQLEYVPCSWTECLKKLENNEIDIMVDVAFSGERNRRFAFNHETVFINWGTLYTRTGFKIESLFDLQHKTVAVMKGSIHTIGEGGIKNLLRQFDIQSTLIEVDSYKEVFELLDNNQADAGVVNRVFGSLSDKEYAISKTSIVFNPRQLRFAFPKNSDSSPSLIERIDHHIRELKKNPDSLYHRAIYSYLSGLPREWILEGKALSEKKVSLTAQEKAWIEEHPVIRLGIDPEFAPFEFIENGTYSGIASDYIKILNKQLGMNMQVIPGLTWNEAVEKARQREIDVLPTVGITKDRKTFLDYSKPYISFHRVIISRTDMPFLSGIDDISGLKVAVQADSSHEGYLKDNTDIIPLLYGTLQGALLAVSEGKADALVGNIASATYWIRKMNLTNLKVAAPVSREIQSLHFAVRKDWPELTGIINKGLDSISLEEKANIRNRWVVIEYKPGIAPRTVVKYILQITIVSLIILAVIAGWNYSLKKEIRKRRKAEKGLEEARDQLEDRVRARTEELVQANKELRTINQIVAACTGALRLNDILNIALDKALALVNLEGGTICLINPDNTFQLAAHRGTSQETIDDLTTNDVKLGECLCGNCASERRPLILWNAEEVLAYASREAQRMEDIRFHAAFPIALKDKALGVLCVFTHTDNKPDKKSLALLETVTSQISLTIENARLYEETLNNAFLLEQKVKERTVKLEEANIRLQELDRLKSMFIASMSHELRTPLNSIIGFTGMTLQGLSGDINEEQKDNLSRAYKSAQHLLNLITDVIDISKVEAGRVEAYPELFSLGEVVNEAVATIETQRKEKGLSLTLNIQADLQIYTDRKRLLQCLINFLSNAVKYSESGHISIDSRDRNSDLELSVRDTGIGIAEEDIPKLFEAFERLQNHLKIKAGGTGLGLYLTKKLATEILHGTISVTSTAGQGSTFSLTIPKDIRHAASTYSEAEYSG